MACRRRASLKQNTWHSAAIDKAFILSSSYSISSIFNYNFTPSCNKVSFKMRFSFPGNFQVTTGTVLPVELLLWPPAGAGHRAGHRPTSAVPRGTLWEELRCQSKGSSIQELLHQLPTMAPQKAQKEQRFCRVLRGPRWILNQLNVTLMPYPNRSTLPCQGTSQNSCLGLHCWHSQLRGSEWICSHSEQNDVSWLRLIWIALFWVNTAARERCRHTVLSVNY